KDWTWVQKPLRSDRPIRNALTVFTDAGRKSGRAAATWKKGAQWQSHVMKASPEDSLQTLELTAVVWAISNFTQPVNVITDSLYVAGVAQRIEDASIKQVKRRRLYELLL
ncbi:POK6 protein, partial [Geococcyx californianus]|nr:POK6 protein [Geococcyx californianus]